MENNIGMDNKAWKRNLVLIAKNTYVWLDQLSKKYLTPITQLDQIPLEEIAEIASKGFNGLWLVGIWQRSSASNRIKHLYGRKDVIASAYSIYEYKIAEDLGGECALAKLREKTSAHNILLACDMVPNHTGLDSPWVFQHPDWYIAADENPRADFCFDTINLSKDPLGEIYLEEGYYNQTGAAEVFKFVSQPNGKIRYIYHGNDGTSMPWNDTAQLNYLNTATRQAVLDEILSVASRFKVIRLDAAMTLVREHFKRLWFPDQGGKKFIPTRDRFNIPDAAFDNLMPKEFWQEVIEKVNKKAPNTLFIAEAFWLMEKYFINEIGMHRVYNSAFMHQLRDEKNEEFKDYIKDILITNPGMLEKFVNFLTTPDERPTVEQFGKSDKYFGACRLMACMPGLPMFGHGQWEGLKEQYGMDIAHPMLDEKPDAELIRKHDSIIKPILQQRSCFSSVQNFRLYDFMQDKDQVNDNVIVFSNVTNDQQSLVIFNNSPNPASGIVHKSVSQLQPQGSQQINQEDLFSSLALDGIKTEHILFHEIPSGKKLKVTARELHTVGLQLDLLPYESHVYCVEPIE